MRITFILYRKRIPIVENFISIISNIFNLSYIKHVNNFHLNKCNLSHVTEEYFCYNVYTDKLHRLYIINLFKGRRKLCIFQK